MRMKVMSPSKGRVPTKGFLAHGQSPTFLRPGVSGRNRHGVLGPSSSLPDRDQCST